MRRLFNEKCFINFSSLKILFKKEVAKSHIPLPWCLFKSINSFLKLVYMIWIFMILKIGRMRNINFLFNVSIQENTFEIHLVELEIHNTNINKQQSYEVTKITIRMLNKLLWREVETLDLYQFPQLELHPVLLYSLVKGSTNKKLIKKQVF